MSNQKNVKAKKPANPDALTMQEMSSAVAKRDFGFYDRLSDGRKETFRKSGTYMLNRYISDPRPKNSAYDQQFYQMSVLLVNDLSNQYDLAEFGLKKHPELQWRLAAMCGNDITRLEYSYIKPPTSSKKRNPVYTWLAEKYPLLKNDELELLLTLNTVDDLKKLAADSGLDDKQIKELFKNK